MKKVTFKSALRHTFVDGTATQEEMLYAFLPFLPIIIGIVIDCIANHILY